MAARFAVPFSLPCAGAAMDLHTICSEDDDPMASFMNRLGLGPIRSGGRDASRRRRVLRFESLEDRALLSFTVDRVGLDSSGDAYTVGQLTGQFNFDPAGSSAGLVNTSVATGIVAKYSPSNTLLWVESFAPASGGTSDGNRNRR